MSINSEHKRMKPVLELAHELDIATNPAPAAIFEAGEGGFQVWCTTQDQPHGWDNIQMNSGSFSKPCEYVGSATWKWEGEVIIGLEIETSAYALAEQKPDEFSDLKEMPQGENRGSIFNREADIIWLKKKISWLFEQAGVALPPFDFEQASQPAPYILAHYIASDGDDYVVMVSPELDPQEFCQPGFVLTDTIELCQAGDFPVDTLLRPEHNYTEPDIEPDEGPLTEQYENASRLGDDDWMEAAYEDRISGWDE